MRQTSQHNKDEAAQPRIVSEEAPRRDRAGFWRRAAILRESTRGRISVESTGFIRQDRDER